MENICRIGFIGMLFFIGCTTSRVTTLWKAENIDAQKYRRIIVAGMIREPDRSLRESMENHLVDDLKAIGYEAVSSLKEYGPKAFEKMDEDSAICTLKTSGMDAVITILLLDKEKEQRYVPVNVYYSPLGYYYYQVGPYRMVLAHPVNEPGYYINDTRYTWESNMYDMNTQKLVYSVQTQSFLNSNADIMGYEYGRLIVDNMLRQKVLEKKSLIPKRGF